MPKRCDARSTSCRNTSTLRAFPPTTSIPTASHRSSFPRRQRSKARRPRRSVMETSASGQDDHRGAIEVRSLSKVYPSQDGPVQALSDVSFAIADAEFVTIVGHSGCGKSTLLRIVAGLLTPSSGSVTVRGRSVTAPLSDVGMVFQRPVLLKWRTMLDIVMPPRPGTVADVIDVELPRPRMPETKLDPRFTECVRMIGRKIGLLYI